MAFNTNGLDDVRHCQIPSRHTIINGLANVEGVRVGARTSAFSFKGKNLNVRKIGEELNVSAVLEGSVRRDGNRLRVFAQLIGVADGYHMWSKTYDRELKNVFAVEDELAAAIVQALTPKLVAERPLVQPTTASTEAHDLYLKGRYLWNQRTEETLRKAKGFFERAITLDPNFALAHSGLADCYSLFMDYSGARAADVLPKAKAHALKAIELDDALAEGHASLGAISEHDYDWVTAERELGRAIGAPVVLGSPLRQGPAPGGARGSGARAATRSDFARGQSHPRHRVLQQPRLHPQRRAIHEDARVGPHVSTGKGVSHSRSSPRRQDCRGDGRPRKREHRFNPAASARPGAGGEGRSNGSATITRGGRRPHHGLVSTRRSGRRS